MQSGQATESAVAISKTLLSLSTPEALAIGAVAGAVVAVGVGATWAYHQWEESEAIKRRKKLDKIMALYRRTLQHPIVPGFPDAKIGLPPPFQYDPSDPKSKIDSMHFTRDQMADFGKDASLSADNALALYDQCIKDAILGLQGYYLSREPKHDHDDVAGVLCYLIRALDKCRSFQGYDYDIAYVGALARFVNGYASLDGSMHSKAFSRLNPIYSALNKAKAALEQHKSRRTLSQTARELFNHTKSANESLLRLYAQLIIPFNEWFYVHTTPFSDLQNGILQRPFLDSIFGIKYHIKSKDIPPSIFRKWFFDLMKYFYSVIDINVPNVLQYTKKPAELFALPDLKRFRALHKKRLIHRTPAEQTELDLLNLQIASIKWIFGQCDNFVTRRLKERPSQENDLAKFIPISGIENIYARSQAVLQPLASFIHMTISLQSYCDNLINSATQLGDIYVRNQDHFKYIFNILYALVNEIQSAANQIKDNVEKIKLENDGFGLLAEQEELRYAIKEKLTGISEVSVRLALRIYAYREMKNIRPGPTIDSVTQEMLSLAGSIHGMYHLDVMRPPSLDEQTARFLSSLNVAQNPLHTFADLKPEPTFWQKHHYKIILGIVIAITSITVIALFALSILSGGAFSLFAAVFAACGLTIGFGGVALALIDGLVGFAIGGCLGLVTGATILATCKIQSDFEMKLEETKAEPGQSTPRTVAHETIPTTTTSVNVPIPSSTAQVIAETHLTPQFSGVAPKSAPVASAVHHEFYLSPSQPRRSHPPAVIALPQPSAKPPSGVEEPVLSATPVPALNLTGRSASIRDH